MNEIKILFTGDFCPHQRIEKLALEENFAAIFNDFIDVFKGNGLNVVNLECPLTESSRERKKTGPHQKASPECIKILKHVNVGLVTLANNHIMDYGASGVKETIKLCKNSGLATVGAGENIQEALRPYSATVKGKKITILNFADAEFLTVPDGPAQANPLEIARNYYEIKNARVKSDYIIVIIHGGNEFYRLPSPRTKQLYRFFIDAGADAVISHHTHCFSGYEIYNQKPIFYGLGNFIYDHPGLVNTGWNQGYIVKLKLKGKIGFELTPLKQCNQKPGVFHLSGKEKKSFYKELHSLNTIISDGYRLEHEFQKYCREVYPMYDAFLEPYFGDIVTALRKRGLFPKLMSKQKRLLLLNIIRCESHREVLLRMLRQYE